MEDLERALAMYEEAIENNPSNADNYFNRGNVRLNQQEFHLAHQDFEAAIQREDRNAKFYHAKGLAYQAEAEAIAKSKNHDRMDEEDKIEHAIVFFRYALEYCSTFIASMFHLGLMYRRTEKFHDALI